MKPFITDYSITLIESNEKEKGHKMGKSYLIEFFVDDEMLLINGGPIDVLDYILKFKCPISRTSFDLSSMSIKCTNVSIESITTMIKWIDDFNCMPYKKILEFFKDLVNERY